VVLGVTRRRPVDPAANDAGADARAAYFDLLMADRLHPYWPLMLDLFVPPPITLAPGETPEPTATGRGRRRAK
jgi:hypothetical protein